MFVVFQIGDFLGINDFINKYYIEPIVAHSGYNVVNTFTYAIIAIVCAYLIYRVFQKHGIKTDQNFIINTIPFVLFGSTVRVITDSIDSKVMQPITPLHEWILNSHLYDYGFVTTSPGIYLFTAVLFFASLFIANKLKNKKLMFYVGFCLWFPHFLILIPMFKYLEFAIPILILTIIPFYICLKYFKNKIFAGIVGAHALDGAATFYILDIFGKITGKNYFEQHVIPSFIGETFRSFFPFYLLKIAIAFAAAYFIMNEKDANENEKCFISLLLIIIGLAPGLRDLLRMVVGV